MHGRRQPQRKARPGVRCQRGKRRQPVFHTLTTNKRQQADIGKKWLVSVDVTGCSEAMSPAALRSYLAELEQECTPPSAENGEALRCPESRDLNALILSFRAYLAERAGGEKSKS